MAKPKINPSALHKSKKKTTTKRRRKRPVVEVEITETEGLEHHHHDDDEAERLRNRYGGHKHDDCNCPKCKDFYRSKNVWAAVCLFILSALTVLGTIKGDNPIVMGIAGMAFSGVWILFRYMTDAPMTPVFNLPAPSEWFKKSGR